VHDVSERAARSIARRHRPELAVDRCLHCAKATCSGASIRPVRRGRPKPVYGADPDEVRGELYRIWPRRVRHRSCRGMAAYLVSLPQYGSLPLPKPSTSFREPSWQNGRCRDGAATSNHRTSLIPATPIADTNFLGPQFARELEAQRPNLQRARSWRTAA